MQMEGISTNYKGWGREKGKIEEGSLQLKTNASLRCENCLNAEGNKSIIF